MNDCIHKSIQCNACIHKSIQCNASDQIRYSIKMKHGSNYSLPTLPPPVEAPSGNYLSGNDHEAKQKGMFIANFHSFVPNSFWRDGMAWSLLAVDLELLDSVDLLRRVQALGAGVGAVLDGVAAVELELVVDGVQALLGELVAAVLYPPGETVHVGAIMVWQQAFITTHHNFKVSNWTKGTSNRNAPLQISVHWRTQK